MVLISRRNFSCKLFEEIRSVRVSDEDLCEAEAPTVPVGETMPPYLRDTRRWAYFKNLEDNLTKRVSAMSAGPTGRDLMIGYSFILSPITNLTPEK